MVEQSEYTDFLYNLVVDLNDLVVAPMWVIAASVVIVAPLTDELLVRRVDTTWFSESFTSVRKAVLASANAFWIDAPQFWELHRCHCIGYSTRMVVYSDALDASLFSCHHAHRMARWKLLISYLVNWSLVNRDDMVSFFWWNFVWGNLVGVILTALGIWLLVHQFRKSSDTVPEDVSGDKPDQL